MRQTLLAAAFCAATLPAAAAENEFEEGMNLLSEGTRLLLEGLMGQMEPALRELQGALQDLDSYHAPEVLPNGDIIIRRKEPMNTLPVPEGEGEIEL